MLKRGTCKALFKLEYSEYHFSRLIEMVMRDPKIMKIMKLMKFFIFEALYLAKHVFEASERCAKAKCSNILRRRGFEPCK